MSIRAHACAFTVPSGKIGMNTRKSQVQKRFPQYGIPNWSLWPNIRFLPLIVAEKNAAKNILGGRKDRDRGKTVYPPPPGGARV